MTRIKKGFTLIEILVSIAIFAVILSGVYAVIIYVFKVTYISRVQVLETQVANEVIETLRNLPYESTGTIGGVPNGVWPQTTTTLRNGASFLVQTTIRNIDDPFDGLAGGSPNDTSPADFKLAEVRVFCSSCTGGQVRPTILTARISPKNTEADSQNGSLFIKVFDASGLLVPGATVHITNTLVNPNVDLTDTTNTNGELKIIDIATSTEGYSVVVSKNGYTTDYTIPETVNNPNPVKPLATVASQTVTNLSFSIDKISTINFSAINPQCSGLSNISFSVSGSKVIGENPNVYRYDQTVSTNSEGTKVLDNLEWDTYSFNLSNGSYDVAGTIPTLPVFLVPDATQNLSVILHSHTTNSLLLTIKDSATKLPLTNAAVSIDKGTFSDSLVTGRGYLRQTDWSGGSGQENFIDETGYFLQDGGVETNSPAGDLYLKKIGNKYQWSGELISSTIDFGTASNFTNIIWEPLSQPAQTGVDSIKFQIATASSSAPSSWNFLGPDGTGETYYTVSDSNISAVHNGDRFLRYKISLSTANQNFSPQLSEVSISYTSGCTPPGQSFFYGLDSGTYNLTVTLPGYQNVITTADVSGRSQVEVLMSP
ncbi:MAG: hypothetical protein UT86_C0004G0077 [Candidatus Magasanikbacteria bacterium GW2011_GWC2_40_17]|uniref:Carboxypeptidase regulatory-like domain-containing protein n=1 Tax=Candidatus Magasanikbacteria bacterium GW2011_GWA2_42_32 TaxID=1619039 RepID=A0A0G1A7X1_9BACT|nr:MAG: hypothetical protein UT86_C0004G0077 [Candidatus Magasanikbacteria bacterium GW2011_GWC2_40_17]KKS57135.1 MAG: hypothetical protein UV20_C0003G0077 [Candidatus Magasanikbacteria bacterium GW2011_GWA2_42_32]OGH85344.1 MAG: hypothetical protein A2294_01060 [Candidatus Magasanikbacteria bacterium RIFOXYB2_FULL_38_10]